jgi:hypothetical protein
MHIANCQEAGRSFCVLDVLSPQASSNTKVAGNSFGNNASNFASYTFAGVKLNTTDFDGFEMNVSANNMTGSISVYAYNK